MSGIVTEMDQAVHWNWEMEQEKLKLKARHSEEVKSGLYMVTIGELTAIISSLASLAAVAFVVVELRNMDKHRDLEISMKLFEWAETDKLRKAFRWIESEFEFKDIKTYKAEVAKNFEVSDYPYQIEAYFEEVGFLVNKKLADIDVIVDRLGSYIITNWQKLDPWIVAVRNERQDKTFGEHFEILYKKTVQYMKKT
jgi:hypothetical protein